MRTNVETGMSDDAVPCEDDVRSGVVTEGADEAFTTTSGDEGCRLPLVTTRGFLALLTGTRSILGSSLRSTKNSSKFSIFASIEKQGWKVTILASAEKAHPLILISKPGNTRRIPHSVDLDLLLCIGCVKMSVTRNSCSFAQDAKTSTNTCPASPNLTLDAPYDEVLGHRAKHQYT